MKPVEFFYWWLPPDHRYKKPRRSSWRMRREEALSSYPGAEPDLSSREVRMCPETPEEVAISATAPYAKKD